MSNGKLAVIKTDLGLIRVESRGLRDVVFLTHNNVRAFTITCYETEASTFAVDKKFYEYDQAQWDEVFKAYVAWKRKMHPSFRLPNYSGRTKSGATHPFRRMLSQKPKKET